MKVNGNLQNIVDKEFLLKKMEINMKEHLKMAFIMVKELIIYKTVISTMENGRMVLKKDMALFILITEIIMKVYFYKIKRVETGYYFLKMEEPMREYGKMISQMEKEH